MPTARARAVAPARRGTGVGREPDVAGPEPSPGRGRDPPVPFTALVTASTRHPRASPSCWPRSAGARASSSARCRWPASSPARFLGTPAGAAGSARGRPPRPTRRCSAWSARCSAACCSPRPRGRGRRCAACSARSPAWAPSTGCSGRCSARRSRSGSRGSPARSRCRRRARASCARDIQRSEILSRLNDALPPSGPLLNALARFDPFPQIDGPARRASPRRRGRDRARSRGGGGRRARVVRMLGTACGLGVEGSGWVRATGSSSRTRTSSRARTTRRCRSAGRGTGCDAVPVAFDARNDVAVLRVDELRRAGAAARGRSRGAGTGAAILGFPRNGPYDVRAARLGGDPRGPHPGRLRPRAGRAPDHARSAASCAPATPAGRWSTGEGRVRRDGLRVGPRRRPARGLRRAQRAGARGARGGARARRRTGLAGPVRGLTGAAPARFAGLRRAPGCPLPSAAHGQDPRHRREAVRRARPRARPARPVPEALGRRGEDRSAGSRAPTTSSPGPSATSSSSPSPTSTTTSSRSGGWPTCRSSPAQFKLVVRDERSQKQMTVVKTLLKRDDVDLVVNACDAGREGELIFAYLFEKAGGASKPGQAAVAVVDDERRDARRARPTCATATEIAQLEEAARSRSEADWIVGMNATRAATIRLRSSFDGAVSLGRVQTPTLAIITRREEEIRAFVPEPYWLVDATFEAERRARLRGPLPRRRPAAARHRRGGRRDRRRRPRPARRRSPSSRSASARRTRRCSTT